MRVSWYFHNPLRSTGMRLVWIALSTAAVLLFADSSTVRAGVPEYMKANLEIGQAFEIKGSWNDHGYFVATDIEALPRPRKPKLRGRIQTINDSAHTVTVFGRTIHVISKTRFVNDGGKDVVFEDLKVDKQIEISCKVDSAGTWYARQIKARGVKASLKIKGTLTRIAVDGTPPDTVEINGLLILLEKLTDLKAPESHGYLMQDEVFGDLTGKAAVDIEQGRALTKKIAFEAQFRETFGSQSEFDLSRATKADIDYADQDLRLRVFAFLTPGIKGFAQLRLQRRFLLTDEQNVGGNDSTGLDFRELYLAVPEIGNSGFGLRVGRQDFDEPREWLFDEYLDAVRVYYYGVAPFLVEAAVIHAVHPIKQRFRTWTDLFARVQAFLNPDNVAAFYLLSRSDTDTSRFREPIWYGLEYNGLFSLSDDDWRGQLAPWFNYALMKGHDKGLPLDAWAFDVGATWQTDQLPWNPSLTISRSVASGDSSPTDQTSTTFRQSGYDDNVARQGSGTLIQYYGTVLDPELSNMKIWTIAVGLMPTPKGSIDMLYHSYRQAYPDTRLRGSNLVIPPARPNAVSDNIGWGIDMIMTSPKFWERWRLKWTLGFFHPGGAFSGFGENAFLNKVHVTVDLG